MAQYFRFLLWTTTFQASFEYQFNSPLKKLKNKYEKTVVRPASRIGNYADVVFLYYDEKRLPGSKTY